jgi:pantoate--beta-alanine ligase
MLIFHFAHDLQTWLNRVPARKEQIGFVPTMGALHKGHLSLVRKASEECSLVVVSIFVNPTQFNEEKDYQLYPSTLTDDIRLLASISNCILYCPSINEIYPQGTTLQQTYPLGVLETVMEGKYRPGHFQGVCQVVDRLLQLVHPDHLYLGEKDFQQCLVIKKLLQYAGIENQIVLHIESTIREDDGLAMSSRNRRLTDEQRIKAATIYQTMLSTERDLKSDSVEYTKEKGILLLESAGFQVDYLEIADGKFLTPLTHIGNSASIRVFIAARLGEVRLIDNMEIHPAS